MNTENFKPILYDFETIFNKQKEIKFLYEPIAKELFDEFDIDLFENQEIFKRYCWRITEELSEALEDKKNINHFKEELIDGFNFMIELYLLYGWDYKTLMSKIAHKKNKESSIELSMDSQILKVIYQLGISANILKNRQWRQSQYLVDLYIFESRFVEIWNEYFKIFEFLNMSDEEVRNLWSLKYQVNLFRIESNY